MAKPKRKRDGTDRIAVSVDDKAKRIAERWIASETLRGALLLAAAVQKHIKASRDRVKTKHGMKRI